MTRSSSKKLAPSQNFVSILLLLHVVACCYMYALSGMLHSYASDFFTSQYNAHTAPRLTVACRHHTIHLNHTSTLPATLMRPFVNTVIGFASGILFILATKQVLGSHEDDEEEEEELGPDKLHQVGWRKMVLIMFVMTLH
jgi:zinc transporter ZupT